MPTAARACCALSVLLAACGTAPAAGPVRERDAAGIEWVRNGAPAWKEGAEWRFVEAATIALPDSGPGLQQVPTSATLGGDGLLYVAGRDPMAVMVYDTTGRFLRSIGRNGEGPGEFRYIMLGLRHDTVLVQDPSLARLSRFGPDGTLLGSTPSVCCMMGPMLPVHPDGRVSVPFPGGWRRGLPGGVLDSVTLPTIRPPGKTTWTFTVPPRQGEPAYEAVADIPFAPSFESEVLPSGAIVWGTTDRYRLIVSRNGRDTTRVIEVPVEEVAVADSVWRAAYANARAGNGVLAYQAPMAGLVKESDIPRNRPRWSALRGDDAGRLWVALPDSARRVSAFHVLDSTGALLGRVASPHPRILEGSWVAGRVLLLDETPEGRALVRVFVLDTTGRR